MVVCPLCEHQQASGDECEVCGKRLAGPGASPRAVATIEGLEPTSSPPVEVALQRLPDLEPTLLGDGGEAPAAGAEAWVEETRARPAEVGAVEPTPFLEAHRAPPIPDEGPEAPERGVCRYCRTPSAPGERFCGRCGMRLPLFDAARVAAEVAGMVCLECGARGEGPRCRRCGSPMALAG